jgi:hypothetical protein
MVIMCWVPAHGELKKAWELDRLIPYDVCTQMASIFNTAGRVAAIVVRCEQLPAVDR